MKRFSCWAIKICSSRGHLSISLQINNRINFSHFLDNFDQRTGWATGTGFLSMQKFYWRETTFQINFNPDFQVWFLSTVSRLLVWIKQISTLPNQHLMLNRLTPISNLKKFHFETNLIKSVSNFKSTKSPVELTAQNEIFHQEFLQLMRPSLQFPADLVTFTK